MGQFGSPHGIKGWLRVRSFTSPPENLLTFDPWWTRELSSGTWRPIRRLAEEPHGKGFRVQLDACDDRTTAQIYTNLTIAIPRCQLPEIEKGTYYWDDLLGFQVTNTMGACLGKIEHFMETSAHDIVVVYGERRHLIPYVMGRYILNVDVAHKTMTVDWDPDF